MLATIAFAIARLAQPGRQALEIDIYVLLIGSMAVATAVLAIREAFPPARGSGIAAALAVEPPPPVRPPDLVRTERLLTMGTSTAFDFHFRLRPILREVAEQRLADRRGLRLDAGSPEVAGGSRGGALGARPARPRGARRALPGRTSTARRWSGRLNGWSLSTMTIDELAEQADRILDEVERAVVGKRDALELVLLGLLADGHVLIEDFPGLAKTLIARVVRAGDRASASRASSSRPT